MALADYAITRGDPRELLLAQLGDIGRISASMRPKFKVELCKFDELGDRNAYYQKVGLLVYGAVSLHLPTLGDVWRVFAWLNVTGHFLGEKGGANEWVEGQYNTRTREGWLKIGVPPEEVNHC